MSPDNPGPPQNQDPPGRQEQQPAGNQPVQAFAAPQPPPGPPAAGGPGGPYPGPVPYPGHTVPPPLRPLILSRAPARRSPKIDIQPDRALVFTDAAGGVVRAASYPNIFELRRYRVRSEVDMARRHSEFVFEVPSRSRPASFVVSLQVSWGVTDPCEVVRIGLEDGLPVLRPRLEEIVAAIGPDYPIGEFVEFEQRLNQTINQRPPVFPEGVGVFHCSARVRQDDRYRSQVHDIDDERHKISVTQVRGSWVDHIDSEWGLLREHLRQNPGNIPEVLAELRQRAADGNARDDERLRLLLGSDLVTDVADLESVMPILDKDRRSDPRELIDRPRVTAERVAEIGPGRDPEEEEDVMPGEIVGEEPGDVEWVDAPWLREGR